MRRAITNTILVTSWLSAACAKAAHAQPASATPPPAAASDWQERYARARRALVETRYFSAARQFEALATSAASPEDRRLALELASLARAQLARQLRSDAPNIRTRDELAVLYSTAFVYGLGTSAWLALQLEPRSVAGTILPFAVITTAAVGSVAILDDYRPLRRGVPHAIATGVYLGFGEGIWLVGYQNARAKRRGLSPWQDKEVATALWTSATAGGVLGSVLGGLREPTPGRAAYTGSSGLWLGLIGGFAAGAIEADDARRGETAFLSAGVAYNLGIAAGLATSRAVSPSIQRVRLVDLGGVAGGLLGVGVYAVAAPESGEARGIIGSAAAGAGTGLIVSWLLTADMPRDPGTMPAAGAPSIRLEPRIAPVGVTLAAVGEL